MGEYGNRALEGAKRKGAMACKTGFNRRSCPYEDHRTYRGAVTFSRAFIKAWLEGWDETNKELKDEDR